jgi:hypothetical protein
MLDAGVNAVVHSGVDGSFSRRLYLFFSGATGIRKRLQPTGREGMRTIEYATHTTDE